MIFNLMKPVPIAEPTMYLYGHEATADETVSAYIGEVGYVGAVLPKLPKWNKEAYPYAVVLYTDDNSIVSGSYHARLYLCANPVFIGHSSVGSNRIRKYMEITGEFQLYGMVSDERMLERVTEGMTLYLGDFAHLANANEWEYMSTNESLTDYNAPTEIIWANHALVEPDENVFVPATDPIPVELVAYSYNGTVLPKLPTWDKTAYPYAYISYRFGDYILLLFSKEGFIKKGTTIINGVEYETTSLSTESGQDPYMVYSSIEGYSTAWEYSHSNDDGSNGIVAPLWGNTDVYNEDGSVYLKATNPIPVYE